MTTSRKITLIVFTIAIVVGYGAIYWATSFVAFVALLMAAFNDTGNTSVSAVAIIVLSICFGLYWAYPIAGAIAIAMAWIKRSAAYGALTFLICLIICLPLVMLFNRYKDYQKDYQESQFAKQNPQAYVQQVLAKVPRNFICPDGSFLSQTDLSTNSTSGIFHYSPDNLQNYSEQLPIFLADPDRKTFFRNESGGGPSTQDVADLLRNCKNTEGHAFMDIYIEETESSTISEHNVPITEKEAIAMVKSISSLTQKLGTFTATSYGTVHDPIQNANAWEISVDDNYYTYYVFVQDGRIMRVN
jgi:hypothetical protein